MGTHDSDAAVGGVLYQRHRPARFSELIGQTSSARLLENAVVSENPPHALLFAGPRGCGKTSAARIFAMALGCTDRCGSEPCGRCGWCTSVRSGSSLDVVEADAASHSGVDKIRELCASAQLASMSGHRVFILDEVHRLSGAAFDALLKTLEEPPPHVTFVLATTELRKVPPTVRSRCVQVKFRLVSPEAMADHLRAVLRIDGIDVSDTVVDAAVSAGAGSVRDTLSAAEALLAGADPLTVEVNAIVSAVEAVDVAAVLCGIDELCSSGTDASEVLEAVAVQCRLRFLESVRGSGAALPPLVAAMEGLGDALARAASGWDTRVAMELCLVARLNTLAERRRNAA